MRALFAAFALLFPPVVLASPADEIAARFVDVLRRDDLGLLARFVDEKQPDSRAWEELRAILDRYDCVTISGYETAPGSESEDRIAFRVVLDGTAAFKAAWRPTRPLPRMWHIEARRDGASWRIWTAITEERRVALEMLAAPSTDAAERIFAAARDANPLELITAYAEELSMANKRERLEHLLSFARGIADATTEIGIRREYAISLMADAPARMLPVAQEEMDLARASGSRDDLVDASLSFGLAQLLNDKREDARATYGAAADLVDVVDDPVTAMKCLQMFIWLSEADPVVRLVANERLNALARRYGWEEGELNALLNATLFHWDVGNLDVVRTVTLEILDLAEAQGNRRMTSFAQYNLAQLDERESHLERAAACYRELLDLGSSGVDTALLNQLAHITMRLGRLDEAEEWARKAEERHRSTPMHGRWSSRTARGSSSCAAARIMPSKRRAKDWRCSTPATR